MSAHGNLLSDAVSLGEPPSGDDQVDHFEVTLSPLSDSIGGERTQTVAAEESSTLFEGLPTGGLWAVEVRPVAVNGASSVDVSGLTTRVVMTQRVDAYAFDGSDIAVVRWKLPDRPQVGIDGWSITWDGGETWRPSGDSEALIPVPVGVPLRFSVTPALTGIGLAAPSPRSSPVTVRYDGLAASVGAVPGDPYGWEAVGSSAEVVDGALQVTVDDPATAKVSTTRSAGSALSVVPGFEYTATAQVRAATAGGAARIAVDWYDVDDEKISTSNGAAVSLEPGEWTDATFAGAAPDSAVTASMSISFPDAEHGDVFSVDSVQFQRVSWWMGWNQLAWHQSSFDTLNSTGWGPSRAGMTIDVTADGDAPDGWALEATAGADGWGVQTEDPWLRFNIDGANLTGVARVKAASTPRDVSASLVWLNNENEQLGVTTGLPVTNTTTSWSRVEVTGAAPPGAVAARLRIETDAAVPGEIHLLDAANICRAGDTCA